jgi:hypothetical protein
MKNFATEFPCHMKNLEFARGAFITLPVSSLDYSYTFFNAKSILIRKKSSFRELMYFQTYQTRVFVIQLKFLTFFLNQNFFCVSLCGGSVDYQFSAVDLH